MEMTVVHLEAVLMPNGEVLHYGKSLGFVSEKQREFIENGASKRSRGNEPMVSLVDDPA